MGDFGREDRVVIGGFGEYGDLLVIEVAAECYGRYFSGFGMYLSRDRCCCSLLDSVELMHHGMEVRHIKPRLGEILLHQVGAIFEYSFENVVVAAVLVFAGGSGFVGEEVAVDEVLGIAAYELAAFHHLVLIRFVGLDEH